MSRSRKPNHFDRNSTEAIRTRLVEYSKELLLHNLLALLDGEQAEDMLESHVECLVENSDSESGLEIVVPDVTEFQLYSIVHEDETAQAQLHTSILREAIPASVLERLVTLCSDAGGWYHRRHGEKDLSFVSLHEWTPLYRAWSLRRLAEDTMTTARSQEPTKGPN